MNSEPPTPSPATGNSAPAPHWPPVTMILLMANALCERFPVVRLSAGWIRQWAVEHLHWQRRQAERVRAIDDPLAAVVGELEQCLANDPPAKRRKILAAWRQVQANTEASSTALTPRYPATAIE